MNDRKDALKNVAASVPDRLKTVMVSTGQDYNTLLIRYTIERFLFRLSDPNTGTVLCSRVPCCLRCGMKPRTG